MKATVDTTVQQTLVDLEKACMEFRGLIELMSGNATMENLAMVFASLHLRIEQGIVDLRGAYSDLAEGQAAVGAWPVAREPRPPAYQIQVGEYFLRNERPTSLPTPVQSAEDVVASIQSLRPKL